MKVLKWIILLLGGLLGLLLVAVLVAYGVANWRINNVTASNRPVEIPTHAEALARGEHLVHAVVGCAGCHGDNLGGKTLLDDPQLGYIAAQNLTAGAGGVGVTFTSEDWELAIRHGIGDDGRALGAMPSHHYAFLSDADLGAILAYLQSLPPVDNELPPRRLSFIATLLFGTVAYGDLPVTQIEHATVGGNAPPEGVTVEYGQYLVNIAACADCHGADLRGRTLEEAQTGPPAGPNLIGASLWNEQDFVNTMRSGRSPSGRQLSDEMPSNFRGMTDAELQAIWRYLQHFFTQ
jgi:mono/diheme cytochrome c family protein